MMMTDFVPSHCERLKSMRQSGGGNLGYERGDECAMTSSLRAHANLQDRKRNHHDYKRRKKHVEELQARKDISGKETKR